MFRHVVMFRWKPETSAGTIAGIVTALRELPDVIPQLRSYRMGSDAGLNEGNYDFVVVADFDSADDYLVYRDNPTHRAIADGQITPNVAVRAAAQFAAD